MQRRAVGIVRVSQVGDRGGDSFVSPEDQRQRVQDACQRDDMQLVDVHDELDVSGGTALADRAGLRSAIELIENGGAEVLIAAYFDRLCRSLRVQDEVVSRVEEAGGQVVAVDIGQVTNGTASQWLSGTLLGAVAEHQRRSVKERTHDAQVRAVARGVAPFPRIPPGYAVGKDRVLVPDPITAPVVADAFQRRADGQTIADVRRFLGEHGIARSYHGVAHLLTSRVVLGEIHFGNMVNPTAHKPIVDRDVWQQVQRTRAPGGRRSKSDRLLARLGVLICAGCGSRMCVGSQVQHGKTYANYRCASHVQDCPKRMAIDAAIAEDVVVKAVREALTNITERASAQANVRNAQQALASADAALRAAVRAFDGLMDMEDAQQRLGELRQARDDADAQVRRLGDVGGRIVNADRDWDSLTIAEQRALIRATVAGAIVQPGRGPDRIRFVLR